MNDLMIPNSDQPESPTPAQFPDLISLKTGVTTTQQSVRAYFEGLFAAEKSGEPFPVNLDDVWLYAFMSKSKAKAALTQGLQEGIDYLINFARDGEIGRPEEVIMMTVRTTERIFIKRCDAILDVYLDCRRIVTDLARASQPSTSTDLVPASQFEEIREMVVSQNQQLVDAREIINELMVAQQGFQECLDKAKLRDDQIQADQRHFDRTAREDRAKLKEALVTMERAAMIVSGEAEWITLPAWCRVMGMKWTEAWLEKAEKVLDRTCKARKIEWKSIPHETLGRVHSYPTELLEEWWKAIPRSEWNEAVEVEADGEDE